MDDDATGVAQATRMDLMVRRAPVCSTPHGLGVLARLVFFASASCTSVQAPVTGGELDTLDSDAGGEMDGDLTTDADEETAVPDADGWDGASETSGDAIVPKPNFLGNALIAGEATGEDGWCHFVRLGPFLWEDSFILPASAGPSITSEAYPKDLKVRNPLVSIADGKVDVKDFEFLPSGVSWEKAEPFLLVAGEVKGRKIVAFTRTDGIKNTCTSPGSDPSCKRSTTIGDITDGTLKGTYFEIKENLGNGLAGASSALLEDSFAEFTLLVSQTTMATYYPTLFSYSFGKGLSLQTSMAHYWSSSELFRFGESKDFGIVVATLATHVRKGTSHMMVIIERIEQFGNKKGRRLNLAFMTVKPAMDSVESRLLPNLAATGRAATMVRGGLDEDEVAVFVGVKPQPGVFDIAQLEHGLVLADMAANATLTDGDALIHGWVPVPANTTLIGATRDGDDLLVGLNRTSYKFKGVDAIYGEKLDNTLRLLRVTKAGKVLEDVDISKVMPDDSWNQMCPMTRVGDRLVWPWTKPYSKPNSAKEQNLSILVTDLHGSITSK